MIDWTDIGIMNDLQPICVQPEDVLEDPDDEWMERLRRGNKIWLVKEGEYATVEWPWEPPGLGRFAGRIGINRSVGDTIILGQCQSWFVTVNGCGMDGKKLFLPVDGHLEDNPSPLLEPQLRQLERELEHLKKKVEYLYLFRGA